VRAWVLAVVLVGMAGTGCKKHITPFDEAASAVGSPEFFAREQVARWLLVYDTVALLAREQGGKNALCWQSDDTWYARSGDKVLRLEGDSMVVVDDADLEAAEALFRAVNRARNNQREGEDLVLSAYARNLGQEIEVWLLPMGLDEVVIGDSWRYVYSPSGREMIGSETWKRGSQVMGADSDLDLTLQSGEEEHPTVAELFFALYYRDSFKSVTIETAKYRVTPMELDGALGWGRSTR